MIYSEDAFSQLTNICQELACGYEVLNQTEKLVRLNVCKDGHEFQVWFDVDKQNYCFNLVSGGAKYCTSLNEFKEFFKVYLTICIDIIPDAKSIVDVFEEIISCNTVYDNFTSDMKSDKVVAHFKVLGKAELVIHVTKYFHDKMYAVSLKESCEGGTKLKTLKEYLYEIDETNQPVLIPNIYSYIDRLYEKYESDEDFDISRYDTSRFNIKYNGDAMIVEVNFINGVEYNVITFNSRQLNPAIKLSVSDVYDLEEVFSTFKMVYEMTETDSISVSSRHYEDFDFSKTVALSESEEKDFSTEEDFGDDTDVVDTDFDNDYISEEFEGTEDTASNDSEASDDFDDSDFESCSESEEAMIESDVTEEEDWNASFTNTSEEEEVIMEEQLDGYIEICIVLITERGENKAVRFIDADKLYDISIEKALSLGIPVSRICETEERRNIRGIFMTDSEKHSRIFAEDITDNDELCVSLVDRLFE